MIRIFQEYFNGNGYKLNGLYISTKDNYQALFGFNTGIIENVIVNGIVEANGIHIAGICVNNMNGVLEKCVSYVTVRNSTNNLSGTSGVVSNLVSGKVIDCINYGDVYSGYQGVGGIVASTSKILANNEIVGCKNYGNITGGGFGTGGIIGFSYAPTNITNCYNKGNLLMNNGGGSLGGIVGSASVPDCDGEVIIRNCKNDGNVEDGSYGTGGIVGGVTYKTKIIECENTGDIYDKRSSAGGIVGSIYNNKAINFEVIIEQSINLGNISSSGRTGGILGSLTNKTVNINNCYNIGNIESNNISYSSSWYGVGGIIGNVYDDTTKSIKSKVIISNSYNSGNITNIWNSSYAGQMIGYDSVSTATDVIRTVTNCYYLSTATGKNTYGGVSVVAGTLKGYASTLNAGQTPTVWVNDVTPNINEGYPILKWQIE